MKPPIDTTRGETIVAAATFQTSLTMYWPPEAGRCYVTAWVMIIYLCRAAFLVSFTYQVPRSGVITLHLKRPRSLTASWNAEAVREHGFIASL